MSKVKSAATTLVTGAKAVLSGQITPFTPTRPGQIQASIFEPFKAASTGVITAKQMTPTGEVKPIQVAISKPQQQTLKVVTTAAKVTGVAASVAAAVAAAPLFAAKAFTPITSGISNQSISPVSPVANMRVTPSVPVQQTPLSLISPISNISTMASPDFSSMLNVGLGAAAGALTKGGQGSGNVIAVGRKYIIKQTSTGKIYAMSRVPRRRFAPRSRGTKIEKLMEMAMLMSIMKSNGGH